MSRFLLSRGKVSCVPAGTSSSLVQIDYAGGLVVGDELVFRDAARTTNLTGPGSGGANELNDLVDVTIAGLADNDILRYDSGTSQWVNEPDTSAQTASSVGGEAEVFKQKTGSDLEFRTVKAGTGITVTQNTDDVEIAIDSTSPYFRDDFDGQESITLLSSQNYIMNTNTLDVYRNGLQLINSIFINPNIDRYQEMTKNSVMLDPGPGNALVPDSTDVFTFIGKDVEPDWKIIITGKTGTVLTIPTYTMGVNNILVFRNGVLQNDQALGDPDQQYSETSSTSITLGSALLSDDIIVVQKATAPSSVEHRDGETGTFISGISSYSLGSDELIVYKNGVLLFNSTTLGGSFDRYQETSSTSITLEEAAVASDVFTFIVK